MKKEIAELTDKARRSLKAAKTLRADKNYDFAVSRAYYAIFYLVQALLLIKGASYSKHAGVISGFYEHYIKPGFLPKELHKTLHWGFELRQQGDYLSAANITREITDEIINQAEKFTKQVKPFLKK